MPMTAGLTDLLPKWGKLLPFYDRAAWLAARGSRVGASEVAALWGNHPYLSLWKLWALKSGVEGAADDSDTGIKRRGRRLELPILEELADRTGWAVEPWQQTDIVEHPDAALRLGCTPDALADDGGGLGTVQVKSASPWAYRAWPRDEDGALTLPAQMAVQVQAELECLGLDRGTLVVLFGFDFDMMEIIPFERHPAFIEALKERLLWFWELVDNGDAPPVDGSDSTTELLKRLYPRDGGPTCELPGDSDLVAKSLEEISEVRKSAEKREQELKNQLIAWIGESTFASTPLGAAFSYKEQERAGVDSKALAADFPEAFKACQKVSRFRVLRRIKAVPNEALA